VGKTLVTASLLYFARTSGLHALAIKPFCTGPLDDVRLLQAFQRGRLSRAEVNPFHFSKPVAPLVAARQAGRAIELDEVLSRIRAAGEKCDLLVVEGAGGLLAPLGEDFTALDLIRELRGHVCVVAANRLGTINHTCLTLQALNQVGHSGSSVLLTRSARRPDPSMNTNRDLLDELLSPIPVLELPWLGTRASTVSAIRANATRTAVIWKALLEQNKKKKSAGLAPGASTLQCTRTYFSRLFTTVPSSATVILGLTPLSSKETS